LEAELITPLSYRQSLSTYLLTCGCGKTVPVEIGQAGGQVACSCGAQLDVPPLRKLRHLPVAATEKDRLPSSWSARKGIIACGLIVAGILAAASLWSRLTEPTIPPFDPVEYEHSVDTHLKSLTPAEGWYRWVDHYRPLAERGYAEFVYRDTAAVQQTIIGKRFFQKMMLILAAICAAIAAAAAIWPRSNAAHPRRRHGTA
jgi:hypothetical protein